MRTPHCPPKSRFPREWRLNRRASIGPYRRGDQIGCGRFVFLPSGGGRRFGRNRVRERPDPGLDPANGGHGDSFRVFSWHLPGGGAPSDRARPFRSPRSGGARRPRSGTLDAEAEEGDRGCGPSPTMGRHARQIMPTDECGALSAQFSGSAFIALPRSATVSPVFGFARWHPRR